MGATRKRGSVTVKVVKILKNKFFTLLLPQHHSRSAGRCGVSPRILNRSHPALWGVGLLLLFFFLGFFSREFWGKVNPLLPGGKESNELVDESQGKKNFVLPQAKEGIYKVIEVIDGDTIKIETGEKVRYQGIDAPEPNEAWGMTAQEKNQELVLGKKVRLELDKVKLDRYGRILAYVWIDNQMANEELLFEGLAKVSTIEKTAKLKYLDRLKKAENRARENHHGLWFDEWVKSVNP